MKNANFTKVGEKKHNSIEYYEILYTCKCYFMC